METGPVTFDTGDPSGYISTAKTCRKALKTLLLPPRSLNFLSMEIALEILAAGITALGVAHASLLVVRIVRRVIAEEAVRLRRHLQAELRGIARVLRSPQPRRGKNRQPRVTDE